LFWALINRLSKKFRQPFLFLFENCISHWYLDYQCHSNAFMTKVTFK